MATSHFLTAAEVAKVLRCTPARVGDLCRDRKLRATMPAGVWLIAEEDLTAFIEAGFDKATKASA